MRRLLLATILLSMQAEPYRIVFHPKKMASESYPCPPLGTCQRKTGAPAWLLNRVRYDDQGRYWELEEGTKLNWVWTPLHDGDVVTMDEKETTRIVGLAP